MQGSRLAKWDAPGHDASSIVGPKLGNVTMWTGFGDSVIGPASITSPSLKLWGSGTTALPIIEYNYNVRYLVTGSRHRDGARNHDMIFHLVHHAYRSCIARQFRIKTQGSNAQDSA